MTREEASELQAGDQVVYQGKHAGTVESVGFSFMNSGVGVHINWPDGRSGMVSNLDDLERA
jgi:preprotein translocase subunit YajC